MTVMIIGAGGFIGRHLCRHLAERDYNLIATLRSSGELPGTEQGIRYRRLELFEPLPDEFDFDEVSCIVYLAARTHVLDETEADPLTAYRRVNVEAAVNLATRAAAAGVARFVYLSSIGVNGNQNSTPFTEADAPNPREPYAESKLEAERELAECCARGDMELVVLRPVLVYGAGAPGNFARLLAAVRRGLPLPLAGIDNCRSLLAVDNLADLIEVCIRHPRAANQVFLAADGDDVSTPELLRKIGAAIGRPARLFRVPSRLLRLAARLAGKTAEFDRLCGSLRADIGKARQRLEWQPPLSLEQALQRLNGE